jgi:LacI family transcriptional regulator
MNSNLDYVSWTNTMDLNPCFPTFFTAVPGIAVPDSKKHREWGRVLDSIVLDRSGGVPLHVQLSNYLRNLIQTTLEDREKLPPESVIVKKLGLALGTVRRAMSVLVSEQLVERHRNHGTLVRKPSTAARLKHIAIIVPDLSSFVISEILNALHKRAQKIGAFTQIIRLPRGVDWKDLSHYVFFSPTEGGVIFCGNPPAVTLSLYRALSGQGYRTVNIGRFPEHYPGHYVAVSNRVAIEMGLEKLASHGHKKIIFLAAEPAEFDEVKDRVWHFRDVAAKMGLKEAKVVTCGTRPWDNSSESAVHSLAEIWAGPDHPTAIFAISDDTALAILFWLNHHGIRVPDQVSLLSFDGSELTRLAMPKMTTLAAPFDKLVERAVELLFSDPDRAQHSTFPPLFAEGNTLKSLIPLN